MNFLSHYYIDREVTNPEYTFGKVLPDLLRISGIKKKIKLEPPKANLDEAQVDILLGIEHHILVDKYWHNSQFFERDFELLKTLLKKQSFSTIKKYYYFYSHILLELMLDRLLIKYDSNIPAHFYEALRQVKEETIHDFFRYNGMKNNTLAFLRFFERFQRSEYLYNYTDNESLVYALGRINERAGVPTFSASDQKLMNEVIVQAERILKDHYLQIFNWIRTKIKR